MKLRSTIALFLTFAAVVGRGVCGDDQDRRTVEVVDVNTRLFRLTAEGCEGITFRLPTGWDLSHGPDGGVAGLSCFSKQSAREVTLVFDRRDRANTDLGVSQDVLLEEARLRDANEEKSRLEDERQISSKTQELNLHQKVTIQAKPRHPRDISVVSALSEVTTADGRKVRIMRWSSPIRGAWVEALIPASGFVVSVDLYSSEDFTPEDIAAICSVASSYSDKSSPKKANQSLQRNAYDYVRPFNLCPSVQRGCYL